MVDTVGGGVSQFATTFFNAVFHGGYDIVERQPHSYWFARYPMGHEATLSWPKPDLVFRNDTKNGVLIKTHTTGTRVTVLLYGDNEGRKVQADVSRRFDVAEPPVELLANPALSPDREKVVERGTPGWSVKVSRTVVYADTTKKSEQRRVIYSPRPRRIEMHPCRIPQGEPGYTGELCPIPESALVEEAEDTVIDDGAELGGE
jgi:vancomycin resistance protein YoaR